MLDTHEWHPSCAALHSLYLQPGRALPEEYITHEADMGDFNLFHTKSLLKVNT